MLPSQEKDSKSSVRFSTADELVAVDAIEHLTRTSYDESECAKNAERRLIRKLDMRIMPIVCLVYMFASEV